MPVIEWTLAYRIPARGNNQLFVNVYMPGQLRIPIYSSRLSPSCLSYLFSSALKILRDYFYHPLRKDVQKINYPQIFLFYLVCLLNGWLQAKSLWEPLCCLLSGNLSGIFNLMEFECESLCSQIAWWHTIAWACRWLSAAWNMEKYNWSFSPQCPCQAWSQVK